MSGQEGKALGLFAEQARAQVSVAKANLAVVGYRAGQAESLQAFSDVGGGCGTSLVACLFGFLDRDGASQNVSPFGVFKTNLLG